MKVHGYSMDSGGDVNGDGYSDLIVGYDRKINIYLGSEDFDATEPNIIIDDSLRYSTAYINLVGDLNYDGYEEIMSFAPNWPNPENPQGKIYIYSYKKITDVKNNNEISPVKFQLFQNYPNPFNPSTTISYSLPYESSVDLIIYDIIGREIKSFNVSSQSAGVQNILWDGKNENGNQVSSGVYIYRITLKSLESNEIYTQTAKLMMLK